jgi:hypothetical protein
MQAQLGLLQAHNDALQIEVGRLQQEIYDLDETSSNMIGPFVTLSELREKYTYMGTQVLVEFILEFKESFGRPELTYQLVSLTKSVIDEVNRQHCSFFPFLPSISKKSTLFLEVNSYLQNNFQKIMRRELRIEDKIPEEWLQDTGIVCELNRLADRLYNLFWQIKLTPNLELNGSLENCNVPMSGGNSLVVVLPAVTHTTSQEVELRGFAF